jgi:hypothetical protein
VQPRGTARLGVSTNSPQVRVSLGALTGVVGLLAMVRLISGVFTGTLSTFAWIFLLLAMVPWIGYASWRARHGHLSARAGLSVLGLAAVGLLSVWLSTIGAVIALICSLAAFVVIWVHDWPPRRPRGHEEFVQIQELVSDE